MNKKLLIALTMFVALIISITGLSYAYFVYERRIEIATIKASSPTYTTVSSEYEMHKYIVDPVDNANDQISTGKNRLAIKLGANIQLTEDMIITRDIAFDLSTYELDLNGYMLKILHNYEGQTTITSNVTGVFINNNSEKKATLDFSTPNCVISTTITDRIAFDGTIDMLAFDENRLVADIYAFVKGRMFEYYWRDLSLPTHYYYYDVKLTYSYSVVTLPEEEGTTFINDIGQVLKLPKINSNAVMTLTLSSSTLIENAHASLQVPFILLSSSVATTYYNDRIAAAEQELLEYFDYYRWGTQGDDYYIFNNLILPKVYSYYNVSLSYQAVSTVVDEDSGLPRTLNSGDVSNFTLLKYNNVTGDGQRSTILSVTYTFNEDGVINQFTRTYKFHIITKTNYDIASKIVESIGVIIIKDDVFVLPTIDDLLDYGIKNVLYTIDGEYYQLTGEDNNVIIANEKGYPPITEKAYVTIEFEFLTGKPTSIKNNYRIYWEGYGSGGGTAFDQYFDAYYQLHSRLGTYLKNGERFASFDMPNLSLSRKVYYGLILTADVPADMTTLPFMGYDKITLPDNKVLVELTDMTTHQEITINFESIPLTDTNITLLYSFNGSNWYGNYSSFTIPGVIRRDTITDEVLFNSIKLQYDVNADGVLLSSEARIDTEVPLILEAIHNWSGIEQLTNLRRLEIKNCEIDSDDLNKIARLTRLTHLTINHCGLTNASISLLPRFDNLKYLNLSNNEITDLSNLKIISSLTELDVSNNLISNVKTLGSYPFLQTLHIENNRIDLFSDLTNISALKTVYLFGNSIGEYYGSVGQYNVTTFTVLYNRHIDVYNQEGIKFVPNENQILGGEILGAISYTSNANGKIELSRNIYNSSGIVIYTISYTSPTFTFSATDSYGKTYATASGLTSGYTYYIIATIVINGTSISRVLEVTMP